jgi:hypothetical protein
MLYSINIDNSQENQKQNYQQKQSVVGRELYSNYPIDEFDKIKSTNNFSLFADVDYKYVATLILVGFFFLVIGSFSGYIANTLRSNSTPKNSSDVSILSR